MGKRTKLGRSYVERRENGTFANFSSIGKSLRQDRLKKAIRKVASGYGHLGDL